MAVLGNEVPIALLALAAVAGCGGAVTGLGAAEEARVFSADELYSPVSPDLWCAATAPGIPVIGTAAAVELPEQGRYGAYVAAGIVPARWVWRTGTDGVLEARDLGRELVYLSTPDDLRVSLTVARTSLNDRDSGGSSSETRLEVGKRLNLLAERRRLTPNWEIGGSLLWLGHEDASRDMFALGAYCRPGVLLRIRGDWELHFYGDLHAWVGGDDDGLQAAVGAGFGVRLVFPFKAPTAG